MRALLEFLVGASIVLTLGFVLALGPPWRSRAPGMAWMLASWAWATVAFETLLLLVLFRVPVPLWLAAVALLAQDGVWVWRLVLLHRERRPPTEAG